MYNHIAQWISRTSSSCKTEILPIKQSPLYLSLTLVTTFLLLVSVNFTTVSCSVRYFETPWTVACQALLSMGFSRQEYWSALLSPSPGDLPHPGEAQFVFLSYQGSPICLSVAGLFHLVLLSSRFIHIVAHVDFCPLLSLNGAYTLCVFCTMSKVLVQP